MIQSWKGSVWEPSGMLRSVAARMLDTEEGHPALQCSAPEQEISRPR